jgi:hypothetical protein
MSGPTEENYEQLQPIQSSTGPTQQIINIIKTVAMKQAICH